MHSIGKVHLYQTVFVLHDRLSILIFPQEGLLQSKLPSCKWLHSWFHKTPPWKVLGSPQTILIKLKNKAIMDMMEIITAFKQSFYEQLGIQILCSSGLTPTCRYRYTNATVWFHLDPSTSSSLFPVLKQYSRCKAYNMHLQTHMHLKTCRCLYMHTNLACTL